MSARNIEIIKRGDRPPKASRFDAEMALVEVSNLQRIVRLHLSRCDSRGAAEEITALLEELTREARQKHLALTRKIP
jgi:hypothetical protein